MSNITFPIEDTIPLSANSDINEIKTAIKKLEDYRDAVIFGNAEKLAQQMDGYDSRN